MDIKFGRTIILVDDYDKAFDFYSLNFFCKKIYDAVSEDGSRYLHVAFNDADTTGIWFLMADTTDQKNKLGKQTAGQPTIVLYTDQSEALYNHLLSNGVTIIEQFVSAPTSKFFHCLDLYGNRITVVELLQSL